MSKKQDEQEEATRRARIRALVALAIGLGALAAVTLLVLWMRAGSAAFFIRDAHTGQNLSDGLLAVVIDARRAPRDPFPRRATVLPGDLFGRYEPAPLEGDEVSEIFVYHIAYKPVLRGAPKDGSLTLEPHGGASFPEMEAQLRALGEISPPVAAALKAAFLPAGPASKEPIASGSSAGGTSAGGSSGAASAGATSGGSAGGAGDVGGEIPGAEPSSETGTAEPSTVDRERREADSLARQIEAVLRIVGTKTPEAKKRTANLIETLDLYNDLAPKDARLKGSAFLMRSVARALEDRRAFDLVRRMVTLAGALWHGTGSAPAPFTGLGDASLVWPDDARREVAIAAARIGGKGAAKELANLLRAGKATLDAPLLGHLDAGGSRAALTAALEAELKSTAPPREDERARIEAAMAALKAAK